MREFSSLATPAVRELLERLVARVAPPEYRQTMRELGNVVAEQVAPLTSVLLICTNDDADFLARGVLESLDAKGFADLLLACFWNERKKVPSDRGPAIDTAPIVRRFVEPAAAVDVFVVVKSVISSACVVRTNITELVGQHNPRRIFVVAPVMFAGARASLEAEFDPRVAERFEYVWFARDDEKKEDGEVVPGIGGSVYELLGIGDSDPKNQYTPELVRQRRAALRTGA